MKIALLLCFALAGSAAPVVQAIGNATISVSPDQAMIDLSVVTQAQTAQAASSQNATLTNSVLSQLQGLLGVNADIKTVSYALSPNYTYANGQAPVLNGYTASNTVQVTTSNLSIVGNVIDTGIQAGANQVQSLQFGLKDDTAARGQALQLAALHAKAHADSMAAGLGLHTGSVQTIQEGASATPIVAVGASAGTASATPVQAGTLSLTATVTIIVALVP